jgi:hypothetical protein
MYKDKDKQKEAAHRAIKRFRAKQENKAIEEAMGITKGITKQGITDRVLPKPNQMPSPGLQTHCAKVYAKNFPKRGKDINYLNGPDDVVKPERTAQGNISLAGPLSKTYTGTTQGYQQALLQG